MHTRRFLAPAAAVLIALCCGQLHAKPKIDTLVYEVKLSSPQGDMGTRKMYKKGDYFVWEADSAGLKIKFVRNKDGAFMIHPKGRFAGKYPPGSNRESPMTFLPGPAGDVKEFLDKNEAKKEGEETFGKTVCDIYTYTEKETKWKCRLWVEQKQLTPVKMRMTGAKENDYVDVKYVSYRTGVVVAESRLALPKDIEVRPVPTPRNEKTAEKKDGEVKQENADTKPAETTDKK